MSEFHSSSSADVSKLSDEDITKLAIEKLPRWKAVCDSPAANTVILNQLAFGKSENEMFLLGLAIKYAGIAGKDVMICSGELGRFKE